MSSSLPPPLSEEENEVDIDNYDEEGSNEITPIVDCNINDHEKCSPGICSVKGSNHHQRKECECPSGFTAHHEQCVDVDECRGNLNECSHNCHNTHGSYHCSCPDGLTLSENRKDCSDFNECSHDRHICGDLQCQNTFGSYRCLCENGEAADSEGKCQQQSLCEENNGGCSQ
jgi:fibulin 1/2